ncbi:MAG TPA: BatA and WFA domain-containing protein [Candidatus Limnocylindria bacterium]|jgi:hypothetical protein|nr:BatA and WFA domain-containing protein [Candidatus Limnocylindria bacterium]
MNFLAPLGFAFAASLPVVVLFYLLKRKRMAHVVSSTLLWQRFLAETQASAPFQRLRHHWLLILQLLLLALVVLALSRPYSKGKLPAGSLQVVVMDASASMQATDESPTRFDVARNEALKMVDGLTPGTEMVILVAGATAEVRQSPTSDKGVLRRTLRNLTATDSATHLVEALRVADSLTQTRPASEVHLFSDGAATGLDEFGTKSLPLVYHRVGKRSNNAGIVSMEVRANPEDPKQRAIFVSVANYATNTIDSTVELLFDDQLKDTQPIELAPSNSVPLVFLVEQPRDGVFTARLTHKDDLAVDNTASVLSRLPGPTKVALVTVGNRFLQKALAAAGPAVEVVVSDKVPADEASYDLVVLDGILPPEPPKANVLAFHVMVTNWFDAPAQNLETPPIVDWRNTHPLLRFVSFDDVQIAESMGVKTPPWASPLIDTTQGTLAVTGEIGRQRIVWVGFDPLRSSWPLRIGFPIFVANCVDWLNPATARSQRFQIHTGEPLRLPLTGLVSDARVILPDGSKQPLLTSSGTSELIFGDTGKQGLYTIESGTNRYVYCANLLDLRESNLEPRAELDLGQRGTLAATATKPANLEIWRWFALVGLGVLMLEWWWFHRRTA